MAASFRRAPASHGGNRPNSDEDGQSLVEFAVCLPVIMLLVTGIFAFGIAFNNYLELTNATAIGARQLAISRGQTTDPCALISGTISTSAATLTKTNITYTFTLNGTKYTGTSCSSSSTTTGAAGKLLQGTAATVTTTYPCALKVYGANYAPSCSLVAVTTELVQ